jgi:thiol-disulfide isomerase/thioredoxin
LTKLFKFYKNDCPPCYAMARNLLQLKLADTMEIVELNVNDETNKELAKENGIDKVPALMLENGNKLIGLKNKEEIMAFINNEHQL